MKALIQALVAQADLNDAQAQKVADVVRNFIGSKLPDTLRGPVEAALTGDRVDNAVDTVKNAVSNFLK
ncbi:hypothetical protein [Pendulispora albinea]|uniref:Uncharacterized protein n=1 Tax=Pendulispora albinea TaxID=2741071 RepID=A0ABZ2M8Z1_9BACT